MADFESIIKSHAGEDGSIPAEAIAKLCKAINTAVGNEFVDKARYKAKLDEIDTLKAEKQTAEDNATTAGKWKTMYDDLKEQFDTYKTEQTGKEAKAAKAAAYRELAKQAGVGDKWLDTVVKVATNTGAIDAMEMEGDKAKDAEKLVDAIKSEFSDFVGAPRTDGVRTATPPASTGGGKTKAEILDIKDTAERQQAIADNPELFGI